MLDQDRLARPPRLLGQAQEHGLEGFELTGWRLTEQAHLQHALQPVDGDLLQVGPAAATAMEQTAGFARCGIEGSEQMLLEGVDSGRHGGSRLRKGSAF